KLGFTRASQPNTAFLPLQVSPAANQPCAHVVELRQLDLQFALVRTRTLSKDIQNQASSIKHAAFQRPLEVTLLAGRQRVIENDQLDLAILDELAQLVDLPAANKIPGRGPVTSHVDES